MVLTEALHIATVSTCSIKLDISELFTLKMSAVKDLVAGECGTSNALVRATQHFTSDQALRNAGIRRTGKIC